MKEKIIGIMGGMGPEATLRLFQQILENTAASRDQDHCRIIIDNNPKIPERLPAILGTGENPVPMMVRSGMALERAGADFIVIPCVSAHFFIRDLRSRLDLPIISMIDETVSLIERQLPKMGKAGILAAQGAIRSRLFEDLLLKAEIESLIPEGRDSETIQADIFRIKDTTGGHDRKVLRKEVLEVARRLVARGAEGMIVGCTELSLVITGDDLPVPVFDALKILALAAIREAGKTSVSSTIF